MRDDAAERWMRSPNPGLDAERPVDLVADSSESPGAIFVATNGGYLVEHFTMPEAHGGGSGLRYRIDLS